MLASFVRLASTSQRADNSRRRENVESNGGGQSRFGAVSTSVENENSQQQLGTARAVVMRNQTMRTGIVGITIALVLAVTPLHAHHSDAGLDMESIVAFEGTVNEFVFRNPHTYVSVQSLDESGEAVDWDLQLGPVNILSRRGWRRDTLQPGDRVTVRAHVAMDGRPYGVIESIDKPGGLGLVTSSGAAQAQPTTATIAGNWMSDRGATMNYPGGFDGFFHALMTPNEKGQGRTGRVRSAIG